MALPSAKYWEKRAEGRLAAVERNSSKYLDQINKLNSGVASQIKGDVEYILRKFAENSNLSIEEAIKILYEAITPAERKRLYELALLVSDPAARAQLMARVNAPAYRARIKRAEAIRIAAQARVSAVIPKQTKIITAGLKSAGSEMYYRTMYDLQHGTGLGFEFAQATEKQIEATVRENWSGEHYSKRIWEYPEIVAERVQEVVSQNVTTGRSWRRCLNEVEDRAEFTGNHNAARLLRTETAYVAAEMEAQAYEEAGLEKYRFLATLDGRTSKTCQSLDGKEINLKDKKTGVNYPPMHPNCRSTTVAIIDGFDMSQLERRARDPETGKTYLVPANTTYKEWQ